MTFRCDNYTFDFTASGFFTLVDSNGEPFYEQALPLFERVVSHLMWIFFWLALILTTQFFAWSTYASPLLMGLIFVHLFFAGCRLTTLLITGGLKPILFPPLWIRLTRKLQKGGGIELLEKYNLHNNPGLLTNLSLIYLTRGERQEALNTLHNALSKAPDNPYLKKALFFIDSYPANN